MIRSSGSRDSKRLLTVFLAVVFALTLAFLPSQTHVEAAAGQPPDLAMARLTNLSIDTSSVPGRRVLRFDTTIVNVGSGPFDLRAQRADASSPWGVSQRIHDSADPTTGGYTSVSTPSTLIFGGDGHTHWHVNNLQSYDLKRLDNGVKVGTGHKNGFCFYDNVPYPGTAAAYYLPETTDPCAPRQPDALHVTMGLSVGWGDLYDHNLPDQYIDITGLTAGRYRLTATADPSSWFTESDRSDNSTWVDVQIKGGSSLKVLRYGPSA